MSFSFYRTNMPAEEAKEAISHDLQLPHPIKSFLRDGVFNLQRRFGKDVPVTITCSGHLFTGEEGNYDVTSATINVQRGVYAEKEETVDDDGQGA